MSRVAISAVCLILSFVSVAGSAEIDFVEDYVLSDDRAATLRSLIPGSQEFYYYSCLHLQATEQFDKVEEMLQAWVKRYKYTARVYEIQNRQALLTYDRNPQQTLNLLRQRLNIKLDHQRERLGETPNLPTSLDPDLLSRRMLQDRAFARYKNLDGFEQRSLDWLIKAGLDPDRRRHLLERLTRPDHERMAEIVVADLNHRYAKPFGSLPIHRQLLVSQLDEVVQLKPELLNQTEYVNTYISKLPADDDTNWRYDAEAYPAYLSRLWTFVAKLAPAHNSLKAHVLYHLLDHDRRSGRYNKERFLSYLRLPRQVTYAKRAYLSLPQNRQVLANIKADFTKVTRLPVIGDDEPLVRSFLQHFFVTETTMRSYEPFVDDAYLRHQFAEAKIVNSLGEEEQWYSMLPPAKYQALKDRIDLEFVATNEQQFAPDDQVSLELFVKNVKNLIVKVYEINTTNYYEKYSKEVNTDVNLDGLVANHEQTFQYNDPPLRRVRRKFNFPRLGGRGVFVIDFIGNGLSSRAVIRKGMLRHIARHTAAGHWFTVLGEQNETIKDARILWQGQRYLAGDDGRILVPYSTEPGRHQIILSTGGFSSLAVFQHAAEDYRLQAGFYVDRESLLPRRKAQLLIRPGLSLNGTPISLSVLEDVRLKIVSSDHSGVLATQEVDALELRDDREFVHELQVPQRLATLRFELHASIPSLTRSAKIELAAKDEIRINQIATTEHVDDLHLARTDSGYHLELLGRTGETKVDRPVQLSLKHREFRNPVQVTLQTDNRGQIILGRLDDIETITATGTSGVARSWSLYGDSHGLPQAVTGIAGTTVEIPYMGSAAGSADVSLLELRGSTFLADRLNAVRIRPGVLVIEGLPAGDYDLLLKRDDQRIRLRIVDGVSHDAYAMGQDRLVELRDQKRLQLVRLHRQADKVLVELKNANAATRVHLFATRYQPSFSVFDRLVTVRDSEPVRRQMGRALSLYAAGRSIGDEYQYIIDRKYTRKFPGLMVDRPSLLLNPWSLRKTETDQQTATEGQPFGVASEAAPGAPPERDAEAASHSSSNDFSEIDFLRDAAVVFANLVPDEQGIVEVPFASIAEYRLLHAVAVDTRSTAYRSLALPDQSPEIQDLRLAGGLDPQRHFTQQKQVSVINSGGQFHLDDITSSRFEVYDSLARVFALYSTLSSNPQLAEFQFVLTWPQLSDEEKKQKYSEFACHELNLFLARKDPEFFAEVIRPFLAHKKDKTFIDHWLLDAPLAEYSRPWQYAQLNCVERILLSQRLATDREYTRRDTLDRFALLPLDLDRVHRVFQTAISTSSLDSSDKLGREVALGMLKLQESTGFERKAIARENIVESYAAASAVAPGRASGRYSESLGGSLGGGVDLAFSQRARLSRVRRLYETVDKTKEWAENNYYQLPIEQQNAELIKVSRLWRDYANHDPQQPFLSTGLADATNNLAEMMFALAVLDLPFESPQHETTYDQRSLTLAAGGPMVVFHEEVREASSAADENPILISQDFFQRDDRYRYEGSERRDKFVTDEFLVQTVYGCQIVVTNPTSTPQKLDVLLQIPSGSMSVLGGQQTKSEHVQLDPYNTKTIEYFFYFPAVGRYPHYPVQVAKNEQFIAAASPVNLRAVETLSRIDRESWEYISQNGSSQDVLAFLTESNLHRVDLSKIAFRMGDRPFFLKVIDILGKRHRYDHSLWAYGVKHNDASTVRTYLQHSNDFVQQCGLYIESPLLSIDPVRRRTYQHTDFRPFINARAHKLGRRRQILNDRFHAQYHEFLKLLSYRRVLTNGDRLAMTYYLLLQDRIEEALDLFTAIEVEQLATRLQYDYFDAYLAMYDEDVDRARTIAAKYENSFAVDRWRDAFGEIRQQLDEIAGSSVQVVDGEDRNQRQTQLADSDASFDFSVEGKQVTVNYQNLQKVAVNYYLMDIELLYSRNPFVQQYSSQFSHIRPNLTETRELPAESATFTFALPSELANRNVLVELRGAGETRTQVYYSNALALQLVENYGQLRLTDSESGTPLPKVYAKVYARMKDGNVKFYKDGYTDLRGRFDYASLNTNALDHVDRFSVLVLSDDHGAVVREAAPPTR